MGIALSTSVSYLIAYFLLTSAIKKKHNIADINKITQEGGYSLLFSIIPGFVVYLLINRLLSIEILIVKIFVEGIVFIVLYGLVIAIVRKNVFNSMIRVIKRR